MIYHDISSLINFYLEKNYIDTDDINYIANQIIHMLSIEKFEYVKAKPNLYESLENIISYAVKQNVISNYQYEKESLEAQITNSFLPLPSSINKENELVGIDKYKRKFYNMSINSNYVKYRDIQKNITYKYQGEKGDIDISINLAKPEKDPLAIKNLKKTNDISYPQCPLCLQNVGFYGNHNKAARSNHRTLKINLADEVWHFQYSPYMYYNEHTIVLNSKHVDMKITDKTIKYQLDFVDQIPDYFIGTNADIPIVGGSILTHNHFQGGKAEFAIESASVIDTFHSGNVQVEYLDWYLQTIRLKSNNRKNLEQLVNAINKKFKSYANEEIKIFNNGNNNAINIITRKDDNQYIVYLILRNNSVDDEHPFGIFHSKERLHHIKRENIGLIEAMGLAILPGRLKSEMKEVEKYILNQENNIADNHLEFAKQLKSKYNKENITNYINLAIASRFEEVLKDCDIFKYIDDEKKKVDIIKEIVL